MYQGFSRKVLPWPLPWWPSCRTNLKNPRFYWAKSACQRQPRPQLGNGYQKAPANDVRRVCCRARSRLAEHVSCAPTRRQPNRDGQPDQGEGRRKILHGELTPPHPSRPLRPPTNSLLRCGRASTALLARDGHGNSAGRSIVKILEIGETQRYGRR